MYYLYCDVKLVKNKKLKQKIQMIETTKTTKVKQHYL